MDEMTKEFAIFWEKFRKDLTNTEATKDHLYILRETCEAAFRAGYAAGQAARALQN